MPSVSCGDARVVGARILANAKACSGAPLTPPVLHRLLRKLQMDGNPPRYVQLPDYANG